MAQAAPSTATASAKCSTFYEDKDGDKFGAPGVKTKVCGSMPPTGYVADNKDCCDVADDPAVAKLVNPSYSGGPTTTPAEGCPDQFDYNCDGVRTPHLTIDRGCSDYNNEGDACPTSAYFGYTGTACGGQITGSASFPVDGVCQAVRGAFVDLQCY